MSTEAKNGRSSVTGPDLPGDADISELQYRAAEAGAKATVKSKVDDFGLGERWQKAAEDPFMDDRAQSMGMADRAVSIVVAIVVAGLLAAFLLPIAIDELTDVDTTGWDGGAAALWEILPVMIVLAIFLFFVTVALRQRK